LNWHTRADASESVRLRSSIDFEQTRADVGAALTECRGTIDASFERIGNSPSIFTINASNVSGKAAGLGIANATALIQSGDASQRLGAVIVNSMSADSHGGRITGRASLEPADPRGKRRFDAELQLADLRFADVLKDYRNVSGDAQPQEAQPDAARGMLDANMTITGEAGNIASRRGRGLVTISDGQVLSVPLLVSLVRVSNLQLPRSETMNFASVEFFIEGAGVNVEQLAVESPSVGIYGFGTASWPDLNLDLRFRTRARNRIPVVTDVIEGIKGEIVTGVVRGAASDPDISVTALTGTSKLIDRILGRDPGEQEKRLEQIEKSRQDAAAREREKNEPTAPK
ncbi:MAG: AsmA-like C-terminal domain-containing protein, partial [Phycisphaerales bacterium]